MKHVVFNAERSDYYKKKQDRLKSERDDNRIVAEDATFIKYYGMSAFLDLFPEARDFPMTWHRAVVKEIQRIEKKQLANKLSGIAMATAAHKSKKNNKLLKRTIREMTKD